MLDINRFVYARYFYSFVKFLAIEGIGIDLRLRPRTIHSLSRSQYGRMVLSDRLVSLTVFSSRSRVIGDEGAEIDFGPIDFQPSRDPAVYDVPMAQHPLMYAKGLWNCPVKKSMSRRAIFFAGNFDSTDYTKIERDGLFNVISRLRLREIILQRGLAHELSTNDMNTVREGCVTLVDSSICPIPMENFRQIVSAYAFFLCAPGAFMPLCHNLVEAMSVGSIPIIQSSYAELLEPLLEHGKNAIIFQKTEDLVAHVEAALCMTQEEIAAMRVHVLEYYNNHLTPRAVVSRVICPETNSIRMLAGESSLALLRMRRATE